MRWLIPSISLLLLATGCRQAVQDDKKVADAGSRPALTTASTPIDVARDYLVGASLASDVEVVSSVEKPTTLSGKPALALHLQWRGKGDAEPRSDLFLIQGQQVKEYVPFNTARSLEENVATVVQWVEAP